MNNTMQPDLKYTYQIPWVFIPIRAYFSANYQTRKNTLLQETHDVRKLKPQVSQFKRETSLQAGKSLT